jgi:hypothetical protein
MPGREIEWYGEALQAWVVDEQAGSQAPIVTSATDITWGGSTGVSEVIALPSDTRSITSPPDLSLSSASYNEIVIRFRDMSRLPLLEWTGLDGTTSPTIPFAKVWSDNEG